MFKNLKLSVKLITSFTVIAFFGAVVAVVGIFSLSRMNSTLDDLYKTNLVPITDISNARLQATFYSRGLRDYIIETEKTAMDALAQKLDGFEAEFFRRIKKYSETQLSQREKELLVKVQPQWDDFKAAAQKVMALSYNDQNKEAFAAVKIGTLPKYQKLDETLQELVEINVKLGDDASSEAATLYQRVRAWMVGLLVVSVVVSLGLAVFIARIITKPVDHLVAGLGKISEGDLSARVTVESTDEIGQLSAAANAMAEALDAKAKLAVQIGEGDLRHEVTLSSDKDTLGLALQKMVQNLRKVVADVRSAAENVAAGSEELTGTAQTLSTGSSEQAASVEEVSASMEQSAASIQQNTDNARQTESISGKAAVDADHAGKSVIQTVQAMKEIAQKISIIEEIARQNGFARPQCRDRGRPRR
ncbi:MAG: MCP four helix bundle domain-containing protein [Nibricoccus sp.]